MINWSLSGRLPKAKLDSAWAFHQSKHLPNTVLENCIMPIVKAWLGRSNPPPRKGKGSRPSDLTQDIAHDKRRLVGAYVQQHRLDRGLTQAELGRLLGVTDNFISSIECGRNAISPERYAEMADALGVSRKTFGKFLMRHYIPWLYAMLYPDDKEASAELLRIPERIGDLREHSHPQ